MKKFDIKIKVLNENAVIPRKQHESDAGYDLHSMEEYKLKPNEIYFLTISVVIETLFSNSLFSDIEPIIIKN